MVKSAVWVGAVCPEFARSGGRLRAFKVAVRIIGWGVSKPTGRLLNSKAKINENLTEAFLCKLRAAARTREVDRARWGRYLTCALCPPATWYPAHAGRMEDNLALEYEWGFGRERYPVVCERVQVIAFGGSHKASFSAPPPDFSSPTAPALDCGVLFWPWLGLALAAGAGLAGWGWLPFCLSYFLFFDGPHWPASQPATSQPHTDCKARAAEQN